mmetsp:Transcript_9247/g.16315  ORF Transcript_9247/g.16315 Transcript_9247/m.16315 type:complete len:133 (+) Transcript_9247:139-537(+)|eukprot:CAMPEP_0197656922 /NCGR_PEP_ID=MMETSP1338-20131121/43960_1 /TAXON_ID=43686 ORGANISM="Pelagodinium beii, Strain RCC1491" /NCGR_SAMPLE_ID=MMETSP1338 /ASSEMBLY_ACC=CAM_ASM_000754 /LENGTH=132 /DNA_ID=CAMNT_0043233159 /DNA_START=122 /DNA_END=520 /DNA_ORIENTATION=+
MASQNVDNFLGTRPSTRVHAPPGGASSISFGGYDAPKAAPKPRRAPLKEVPVTTASVAAPKVTITAATAAKPAASASASATTTAAAAAGGRVSSNAYARGDNQNCGNVITDRPSTRLHAPPGGKSSFSLGWS